MTADQRFLAIGIYINSALYLSGVFVAGLIVRNQLAWKLALVTAGLSYLSYTVQVLKPEPRRDTANVLVSAFTGAAAGLSLIPW